MADIDMKLKAQFRSIKRDLANCQDSDHHQKVTIMLKLERLRDEIQKQVDHYDRYGTSRKRSRSCWDAVENLIDMKQLRSSINTLVHELKSSLQLL